MMTVQRGRSPHRSTDRRRQRSRSRSPLSFREAWRQADRQPHQDRRRSSQQRPPDCFGREPYRWIADERSLQPRQPRGDDRRLVLRGMHTADPRIDRLAQVRADAESVEYRDQYARHDTPARPPPPVEPAIRAPQNTSDTLSDAIAANITANAATIRCMTSRHDERQPDPSPHTARRATDADNADSGYNHNYYLLRRAHLFATAATASATAAAANQDSTADEYARYTDLNRQLAQLRTEHEARTARFLAHRQEHAAYLVARDAAAARADAAIASQRMQDDYSAARHDDARHDGDIHAVDARRIEATRADARRADAATAIEAACHARRAYAAAAAEGNDADADAVPWGDDIVDFRHLRVVEAVRVHAAQRDAEAVRVLSHGERIRRALAVESIDVDADDDEPRDIDVDAYRQQLVRRQRDAEALAVVAAAGDRNLAEVANRPLDASVRRAEVDAGILLAASQPDVAVAVAAAPAHDACGAAAIASDHAAAAAEGDDAGIALWSCAHRGRCHNPWTKWD